MGEVQDGSDDLAAPTRYTESRATAPTRSDTNFMSSVGETILLVEDDPLVRGLFGQHVTERGCSDMPVLFVSGYTDSASHAEIVRNHAAYLQKPVARAVFLDKERQLLDARRPAVLVAPAVAPRGDL